MQNPLQGVGKSTNQKGKTNMEDKRRIELNT
jgi:hypothetical protein